MRPASLRRFLAASLLVLLAAPAADAIDSAALKPIFANPPREYSTGPLWVWNDMLTDEQVVGTLRDLAAQNVKQAWVHPRPGLMTPYLSEEWFRLWKLALAEAEKLDMNLWIYDENSYPSGFAGGWVPELMPESRGRGLFSATAKKAPKWADNIVAVYRMKETLTPALSQGEREKGATAEPVTEKVRAGESLPDGEYLIYSVRRAANAGWTAGRCYVDLMYPGVTQKFLEVTLDKYAKELGDQFGKRTPGSFTDEPNLRPAGGLPWTEDLPQQFEKRFGYRLTDNLASLSRDVGDYRKVRHDYYQTLLDLFIERFAKPYHDWCAAHNIEFTGHWWEHEWPNCQGVPDNMAMAAWEQRPGIDILMNQYAEDVHAQFGNIRSVKEVASIANQLGLKRTLCEVYGAGGWDLRFEDMKRIGDWIEVLGINTPNQHLSYVTLRGARKADHPQSFSYHEPWWEAYHVSATYFARLSAALSAGEQVNHILVIEPTTTAWMYNKEGGNDPRLKEIGDGFQKLLVELERNQVEYDLGCENVIASNGSVEGEEFVVGKRKYNTLVLPPMTENLSAKTAKLLTEYVKTGAQVFCFGAPPSRIDGKQSSTLAALPKTGNWRTLDKLTPQALFQLVSFEAIQRAADDKGTLFHHRRQLEDGQVLFLVNTSATDWSSGRVISPRSGSADVWDLNSGKSSPYPFKPAAFGIELSFRIPPSGSLLLCLSNEKRVPVPAIAEKVANIAATGDPVVKRIGPNVLTLDYVDITAGGETRKDQYFYPANQFAFQKNGMARNPWDSAVQFKDELISRKFPADSGFEATYRFTIADKVPADLQIVIERPDLYTITCNGKAVKGSGTAGRNGPEGAAHQRFLTPSPGKWWLDRAFGRVDIASAAKVGENAVTIKASPFTIYHELEPAYVLGDFALEPTERGFTVRDARELKLGKWNEQGCPFYAEGVSYTQSFDVPAGAGSYRIAVPNWLGSVAKVNVNGKLAGYVVSQPYQVDITPLVKSGANSVEVIVIGTLKNTLGPHHGNPRLGSAWPAGFHAAAKQSPAPGNEYSTVGYGLFAPFELQKITRE